MATGIWSLNTSYWQHARLHAQLHQCRSGEFF